MNTELQKKVRYDFEKDFYKLMNDLVFSKARRNVRKDGVMNHVTQDEIIWYENQITTQLNGFLKNY